MNKNFLRALSGENNLIGIAIFRIIIGLVLVVYGFVIFFLIPKSDIWTRISIPTALWALGLMFILDGQSILREYFRSDSNTDNSRGVEHPGGSWGRIAWTLFIVGSALFLVKFYKSENVNFYPLTIFLIAILLVIVFHEKIESFGFSKEKGIYVNMKKQKESQYHTIENKKNELNYFEVGESENVR